MRPRNLIVLALIALCLPTAGCRHRQTPKTAPDLPVSTAPTAPTLETKPTASEPETVPAPEPDPLSGDLDSVNEYLRRQGLVGDAYFNYDQADLSDEARDQLASNARFLSGNSQFVFTLEGHCDERGTAEYNLALGERRAQAAKSYMVSLGVPASRLSTISYGKERPVCADADESCWEQNRRAHPVVTGRNDG